MASTDWAAVVGSLDTTAILQGVTGATAVAPGGGSFSYAFRSILGTPGVAALHHTAGAFAPADNGGSIRGALQRGRTLVSGGFAPLLFLALQDDDVGEDAYVLGLADAEPSHLVLRKGPLDVGAPDVAPGFQGVLRRSTATFASGTWLHLRLDASKLDSGDVRLRVFLNDLSAQPLGMPSRWVSVDGMGEYTDPAVSSLIGGFSGFGFRNEDEADKHAFCDHIEIYRQI